MLKLRNLTLLRRVYVYMLTLMTRLAYGTDQVANARRNRPGQNGPSNARLQRINSELEFQPGAWEGAFLDVPWDHLTATSSQSTRTGLQSTGTTTTQSTPPLDPSRSSGKQKNPPTSKNKPFQLADAAVCIADAADAIVGDSLTRCFTSEPSEPWNFLTRNNPSGQWQLTPYVYLLWLLGLWVRYCVLLPVRVTILAVGSFSFASAFMSTALLPRKLAIRKFLRQWLLRYLASVFVASWSGYIRFHGKRPKKRANQIYVANHTSLIDVIVLMKDYNYSFIGQRHTGVAGFLQDMMVSAQDHVWFDREEGKDRRAVQDLLKDHVRDGSNEAMLVFPEGTCTTTDYCVMFKKGSFELGADVFPVAMRYRKEFGDTFWNSQTTSFPRHLVDLMTSWSVVCDVYYLEPERIQPGESAVQFANRVKKKICERAGLIDVNWDGFLKRHRISSKFLEQRQKAFASVVMRRLKGDMPRPWSTTTMAVFQNAGAAESRDGRTSNGSHSLSAGDVPLNGSGAMETAVDTDGLRLRRSTSLVASRALVGQDSRGSSSSGVHVGSGAVIASASATRPRPRSRPARAGAAIASAATGAVRWGIAFGMLAVAMAVTLMLMPRSWKDLVGML